MSNIKKYAPCLVRISVSLVFLWFGINQFLAPEKFYGYLPSWAVNYIGMHMAYVSQNIRILILINGLLEIILGFLLLLGVFTRVSALILSMHLFAIMLSLGYNDVAVRDFGLSMAAFSVFLNGHDFFCHDNNLKKRIRNKFLIKYLYFFDND